MMTSKEVAAALSPLSFEQFWNWLQSHPNCILRAGTIDSIVYDHEDHHWRFHLGDDGTACAQMIRGKRLIAEVLIDPKEVAFVGRSTNDREEFLFDLHDSGQRVLYYFAMTHDFDAEDEPVPTQWN